MTTTMTSDICEIITKYIQKPKYELLDWINIQDLNFENLSANSNAIELLKENHENIDWYMLSKNPNPEAIELLKANQGKINYNTIKYKYWKYN